MGILSGKTAFITGSSRGIGRAAALKLAALGARVVLHGASFSDKLRTVQQEAGPGTEALCADLGKREEVEKLLAALYERSLVPDILVLNASVQSYTGIGNFDDAEWERMFRSNVESSCILLHELLPRMTERTWGRVIFVGSINGIKPASRLALYGSTKAALQNIACTAANESAPFGVTVNTILPGVIETDRNAKALSDPAFAESLRQQIPMHRFGSAEECAELIGFLASPGAAYITGAEIPIAGGWQL